MEKQKEGTLLEAVISRLREKLKEDYLGEYVGREKRVYVNVKNNAVKPVAELLKGEFDARLVTISVNDLDFKGFEVLYHYAFDYKDKTFDESLTLTVKTTLSRETPSVDSVSPIYYSAVYAEREMGELNGITFEELIDPRHFVLPYEWPGEVEEVKVEKVMEHSAEEQRKKVGKWIPLPVDVEGKPELSIVPIGPFHPLLVEAWYFRLKVDGEKIVEADMKPGFNHRGIMKLMEKRSYWRNIYISERVCGICSHAHTSAYCRTVEMLGDIELPDRGRYVRTLIKELERIHSHLLWAGVGMDLIGYKTAFMWFWRDREHVLDIFEMVSGNRVNHAMNTIGGVRRDITRDMIPKIEKTLDVLEKATKKYIDIATSEPLIRKRTIGIGVLTKDAAKEVGVVGPTARGSNVRIDVRKDDPYLAYRETSWDVITQSDGDVYAKVIVRLLELLQSISICRQCLDFLQKTSGPIQSEIPKEFPEGKEAIGRVEAPRGELTYYIRSNGTHIPDRVRIRTPSFLNNPSTLYMLRDQTIADAPIIIASIDPCLACTDRSIMIVLEDIKEKKVKPVSFSMLAEKSRLKSRRVENG
ncbi:MAG: hydrogenase large subunit [Candidatus Bathyarchaeota archaeon]